MYGFSADRDRETNFGELVLETLLNSNIESITHLYLEYNRSWFSHPVTVDLLLELITMQRGL